MVAATAKQIQTIHAILHSKGLLSQKSNIVSGASEGRTSSSKELTYAEADFLIKSFSSPAKGDSADSKMLGKLFAMAYELGWITSESIVNPDGSVTSRKNYSVLYNWVEKFGYKKKGINLYKRGEIPFLITQFERGPYSYYLHGGKKNK